MLQRSVEGKKGWANSITRWQAGCGIFIEFEIVGLRTERGGDITEEDAKREGYPNLAMYRALIERMHQGMEWDQDQPVWVHEFARLDAAPAVRACLGIPGRS